MKKVRRLTVVVEYTDGTSGVIPIERPMEAVLMDISPGDIEYGDVILPSSVRKARIDVTFSYDDQQDNWREVLRATTGV